MPAEDELVDALIEVLEDPESELNISAARTLGRIASPRAIPALRRTLFSGYRPLEANSARSLALLGDEESVPHFQAQLQRETNPRLRLAYVSALGQLRVAGAVGQLFDLLQQAHGRKYRGGRLAWLLRVLSGMRSIIYNTGAHSIPTSTRRRPRRCWPFRSRPIAAGLLNRQR